MPDRSFLPWRCHNGACGDHIHLVEDDREQRLEDLYRRHAPFVHAFARRRVDAGTAEEMGARQRAAGAVRLLIRPLTAALMLGWLVMGSPATVGAAPARSPRVRREAAGRRIAPLRPPAEHIPKGVSALTVHATATVPRAISVSQTITNPHGIQRVVAVIESLQPIGDVTFSCPASRPGELTLELQFRKARQEEPLVTVTASRGGCALVEFSAHGKRQPLLVTASHEADSSAVLC